MTLFEVLRWSAGKIAQFAGVEIASAKAVTSATALVSGDGRMIRTDTTGGAFNLDLPASPYNGMQFTIYDGAAAGSWNTNNLTVRGVVGGSGKQIVISGAAAADTVVLSTRSQSISFRYDSTSTLWHSISKN